VPPAADASAPRAKPRGSRICSLSGNAVRQFTITTACVGPLRRRSSKSEALLASHRCRPRTAHSARWCALEVQHAPRAPLSARCTARGANHHCASGARLAGTSERRSRRSAAVAHRTAGRGALCNQSLKVALAAAAVAGAQLELASRRRFSEQSALVTVLT